MKISKEPRISAILPTWNRADYLHKALKGLTGQTLDPDAFEVIIVDDGSTDATRQVVDLFSSRLDLTYVYQDNAGIAAAKNRGIEEARSPLLLFMDDDDVAGATLLEEHLWSHERYPDPGIAVLGRTELSSRIALHPVMHFVTEVDFYLFCYPGIAPDELLDYTYFWGGRSSCKTALLRDHGGFNPVFRFGCEDIELGYRLSRFGFRVRYNPRAVSTMLRALSFDDFCRRVERQGESNWVFSVLHPVEEIRIWGDVVRARERWGELEADFDTILTKARHLDRIAALRAEAGLELDDFLVTELHKAYRQSFDGCRLRGVTRAAQERGDHIPGLSISNSNKKKLPMAVGNLSALYRSSPNEQTEERERVLVSWPAYAFARFRDARRAIYTDRLGSIQVPGVPGKVSVIFPACGEHSRVAGTIVSILDQAYTNFELIIVGDDSVVAIAERFVQPATNEERIKFLRQPEQHFATALNDGLRYAAGEFLTWISADYQLRSDFLQRLVDWLQHHPDVDMVSASANLSRADGQSAGEARCPPSPGLCSSHEHGFVSPDAAGLSLSASDFAGPAFLYRNRMELLLGGCSVHRSGAEAVDFQMRLSAVGNVRHVDFPELLWESQALDVSRDDHGEEPKISGRQDALMVFEDARRDFYLSPVAWIIETLSDRPALRTTKEIRAWVQGARHVGLDPATLAGQPGYQWWFPIVALKVTSDPNDAVAIPPNWPTQACRVLVLTGTVPLPSNVAAQWDLCVTTQVLPEPPPPLPGRRRGWLTASRIDALCSALDIRVKQANLAALEDQIAEPDTPQFRFSAVICTYHRGALLKDALLSVAGQTIPPEAYEVIVVNNDPGDPMVHELVEEVRKTDFMHRPERLVEVPCPFKGLSLARNAGITRARGEMVAFIDDDASAFPDWLEEINKAALAFPEAGVIGGQILLDVPKPRPLWLKEGWEHYWSHFELDYSEPRIVEGWGSFPWGANWCARRQALMEIGGFRTRYGRCGNDFAGGEEVVATALIQRLGYKIAMAPAARVVHNPDRRRYSLKHLRRTIRSIVNTTYQVQIDLYAPEIPSIEYIESLRKEHQEAAFSKIP